MIFQFTAGSQLYFVFGPVNAKNISLNWNFVSSDGEVKKSEVTSYKVTWRRVDGKVGHPGHETTVLNSPYIVKGLIPGTRCL